MKRSIHLKALAAGFVLLSSGPAYADGLSYLPGFGEWKEEWPRHQVFVGAVRLNTPVEESDDYSNFLPDSGVSVGSDWMFGAAYLYHLDANFTFQVQLGSGFRSTLSPDGNGYDAVGVDALGDVDILPPQAYLIYNFTDPDARIRPFVGAGGGYVIIDNEQPSPEAIAALGPDLDLKVDNTAFFGLTAGIQVDIGDGWGSRVQVNYNHISVNTELTAASLAGGPVTNTVKVRPILLAAGLTYRF